MARPTRFLLALTAALAAPVFAAGCGGSDDPEVPSFDKAALQQPIEVEAGSDFKIVLDANNTTPYAWRFAHPIDASVVQYDSRKYETDPGSEGLTGAGGTESFDFTAYKPGHAKIDLVYKEITGSGNIADKVTANLTVTPAG